MRRPVRLLHHIRYRFENTLSAGPIAIMGWLAVASGAIVFIAAAVVAFFGIPADPESGARWGFTEGAWQLLMRTFDAGNMADDTGWALRLVTLLVTIGGIFIVSTLIGTITSGIESAIEEMRKGRSQVIETGHTLILGWSPKVFTIIFELVTANQNQHRPRIVILAYKDKIEMEDAIRAKLPATKNTRVICRRGSPLDLDDLEVASPHDAKSIIILSPEAPHADTHVVKAILAITNNPRRKSTRYHIIAELQDMKNMEAAQLVSGDEVSLILTSDVIARVTAQTCRQSGLSVIYQELMDFDGAEIYFKEEPSLVGLTYRQALSRFDTSAMIGIMAADERVLVNPKMDLVIERGDKIIAISEDDDTIRLTSPPKVSQLPCVVQSVRSQPAKERTLLIGWSDKSVNIIREMDCYVGDASEVVVLSEDHSAPASLAQLQAQLKRQTVRFVNGATTERSTLAIVEPATFNHIVVLSDTSLDVQEADARTLITLLHLRNLAEEANSHFSIVSEMRDIRNRALAEVARADDFIVSDKLVSLLLSQISENRHLSSVFKDLFDPDGSEIYLKPIADYVPIDTPLTFYAALEAAAARGETAIGYRISSLTHDPLKAYGVRLNPVKSEVVRFSAVDRIVVLAEN